MYEKFANYKWNWSAIRELLWRVFCKKSAQKRKGQVEGPPVLYKWVYGRRRDQRGWE